MSNTNETYEREMDETKETGFPTHTSPSENQMDGKTAFHAPSTENQELPIKRGPGRPRKHPLPVQATTQKPVAYAPKPAYTTTPHPYMDPQIEKYIMKKKVKKYVQHYLTKYGHPSFYSSQQAGSSRPNTWTQEDEYDDDDEHEDVEKDYETTDHNKENVKPHLHHPYSNASSLAPQDQSSNAYVPTTNSKLDQILGRRRR